MNPGNANRTAQIVVDRRALRKQRLLNLITLNEFVLNDNPPSVVGHFVDAARRVHGLHYSYDLVKLPFGRKIHGCKIQISCIHGPTQITVKDHLMGFGCLQCAIESRGFTTENFIAKAQQVHGLEKYSYHTVLYVNSVSHIDIRCNTHQMIFKQTPMSHLVGQGCPKCKGQILQLKADAFLEKAQKVHGDKYEYDYSSYRGYRNKIRIKCKKHGWFSQNVKKHLKGQGCPHKECRYANVKTNQNDLYHKALECWGTQYGIENVKNAKNTTEKIDIECFIHGFWKTTMSNFISMKHGCAKCEYDRRRMTTENFIKKAKLIHPNGWDNYDDFKYVNYDTIGVINCIHPEHPHGPYLMAPEVHTRRNKASRCQSCASNGIDSNNKVWLYYAKLTHDDGHVVYKIGITSRRTVEDRFYGKAKIILDVLKRKLYENGYEARAAEHVIKTKFKSDLFIGPKILPAGDGELFSRDVLGLDPASPYFNQVENMGDFSI